MIFNDLLPTELWFIIFKMEHSTFLDAVNKQIKTLNREIELLNKTEFAKIERGWGERLGSFGDEGDIAFDHFSDFPRSWAHCCPQVTHWTIKEWNRFRRVHPTIVVLNNGSIDLFTPQGAYGYGYSPEMRREVVVEYLFDW